MSDETEQNRIESEEEWLKDRLTLFPKHQHKQIAREHREFCAALRKKLAELESEKCNRCAFSGALKDNVVYLKVVNSHLEAERDQLKAENAQLQDRVEELEGALDITYDWLTSDSIFTDSSQISFHRKVLSKVVLPTNSKESDNG